MPHTRILTGVRNTPAKPSVLTRPLWLVAASVAAAGLLNCLLAMLNGRLSSPFFLDSLFTACAGALFGWVPGLLAGLWTNLAGEITHGFHLRFLPFAICDMMPGVVVGLMASRGLFHSGKIALTASLTLAFLNSLFAAVAVTLFYGGVTGQAPVDYIVVGLLASGISAFPAAFLARIPINLVDQGAAVFAAFFLLDFLTRRYGWPALPGKRDRMTLPQRQGSRNMLSR